MMNDSKPCGPSGGFQAPSPKRRRPRLRMSCSPSPHPSPQGEGERWHSAWKIRTLRLQSPLPCLSFRRHTTSEHGRITKARANVSPSPWGEGWGEGERSKLQPQAHDDSRNCQTSRVPRHSRTAVESRKSAPETQAVFSLSSDEGGGEGWGEELGFIGFPLSPALSPLVPRGVRECKRAECI